MGNLNIENACTTSRDEPVGTASLAAAACNLGHLDRVANSDELTDDNRIGKTVDTIAGFQSKVDIALRDAEQSFGFIVAGTFADGFTITNYNQLGQDASGNTWRYRGVTLPFTVVAGTTPSSPDYEQIEFSSASGITYSTGTVEDALDDITDGTTAINNLSLPYVFDTVADYKAFTTVFPDGKIIILSDRKAKFKKINGLVLSNDMDIIGGTGAFQNIEYIIDESDIDLVGLGFLADRDTTTGIGTDNSQVIQRGIDIANEASLGGVYGGGGYNLKFPAGQAVYSGFVMKSGVNLIGKGANISLLFLSGGTATGIKCLAADTQSNADQISRGTFRGFSLYSNESAPTSQVQWDATGFSRWKVDDVLFEWFGGCNGIEIIDSKLAGNGGPALWYNDLYACFFIRRASSPAGGIAINVGSSDMGFEKATAWTFVGGRISGGGSGTGISLRTNNFTFLGMKFEGLTTANDIGSAGTRGASTNSFFGCYYEANTTNRRVRSNGLFNSWNDTYITGGVDDIASDSKTTIDDPNIFKSYIGNSAESIWEIAIENAGNYRPTFRGLNTISGYDVLNASGEGFVTLTNAGSSPEDQVVRVFDPDITTPMLEYGTDEAKFQASVLKLGNNSDVGFWVGTGTPEGNLAAGVGSTFSRTDGGAGTSFYVKESGAGNTGWVAK